MENSKIIILNKAAQDSTLLQKPDFGESNYSIHRVSKEAALQATDQYADMLLYMVNESDYNLALKKYYRNQKMEIKD